MDYLASTGNRLHDLELDRILSRISSLEATTNATSTTTPAAVQTVVTATVAGVRSLTPGSGTPLMGDVSLAVAGPLSLAQSGQSITLTATGSTPIPTDVLVISPGSSSFSWAVPSAHTEFNGLTIYRAQHDLTHATQARLVLVVSSESSANIPTLAVQYSADGGSTWNYLDGSSGPSVLWANGVTVSSWVTLTGGAQGDVLLRVVGSGGNGSASVSFGALYVQAR